MIAGNGSSVTGRVVVVGLAAYLLPWYQGLAAMLEMRPTTRSSFADSSMMTVTMMRESPLR